MFDALNVAKPTLLAPSMDLTELKNSLEIAVWITCSCSLEIAALGRDLENSTSGLAGAARLVARKAVESAFRVALSELCPRLGLTSRGLQKYMPLF